jgi:hypothetical protein
VVFDHNVRCAPMSQRGDTGVQEPARIAHNDYTLGSGPQRVRDLLGPQEAEQRLKHRVTTTPWAQGHNASGICWAPRRPSSASSIALCRLISGVRSEDLARRAASGEH